MSTFHPRTYRLYCFDALQKVVSAEWLDASTDEDALIEAQAHASDRQCEIWEGSRLVAQVGFEQRSAQAR